MSPQLTRTTAGLAAGITLAVGAAFAVGAYLYSNYHFNTLLEASRKTALGRGELIREALEHQMMEKDRVLLGQMVRGFGGQPDVEALDVLDHQGRVWYSSRPGVEGTTLSEDSPSCQVCHRFPGPERTSSQIVESGDQRLLRVVVPLRNEERCQSCHAPDVSINGLVILDSDVGGMRASLTRDLLRMVAGSALLAFVLVGVVVGIVQVLLLRRLHRFETDARLIADGDLERRVAVKGSDTISWLGREFNTMADSVTGLLREVGQERERLETVINSIDDGIVVLDPHRRIVAANTSFLGRTGLSRDGILGCVCGDVAGGICNATDCPTLACLSTGRHQVRICQRVEPGGAVAWEEVHSSPVRGPSGEIAQVVEVWRDISERRGAEARLAESHRLASLGTLASGFSHEMNTPLATILTCVEGILREVRTDGDFSPAAERIGETASMAREQILRCKGITQHFLRLSRGHSSPGDILEVGGLVEAVLRLVDSTANARGVSIRMDPLPSDVRVRADDSDLQHALINLLINAIEASEPGGTVQVQVEEDTSVRIRVIDGGRGISPEQVTRVFEPFVGFREGGTGLGLFLALNFVRQWGGDILVRSAPGKGSAFEIELPVIAVGAGEEARS